MSADEPTPEVAEHTHRLLADVPPLDVTGVRTVVVGTIIWAIAFLALLPFYGTLRDNGDLWWLWTCVAGFGLGVFGWVYCTRRARRLAAGG